ncbi:MAG: SMC-Scp complex subunit ScpB [Clostridia bacterium]|nr:SMC-Scp complex subunit ScpB [Clostridia bacterium]
MDNGQNIDIKNTEAAIEAILFAAGHPITYEKIAEVLDLFESQVREKVFAFAEEYNKDEKKGIMLLTFEDRCQLCTKEQYLPCIKDALGIRKGGNLSASSLEVLAIIAYNQAIRPVTRAFVDMVRKVDSAYIVASLCEKNLIEPCGRLDAPGRPHVYRTTSTFLRCFGIESLEQLPYVELPMAQNEGEVIPLDIEIPEPRNENEGDSLGGENADENTATDAIGETADEAVDEMTDEAVDTDTSDDFDDEESDEDLD